MRTSLTKESAMSTAQTLPTVFSGSSSTWEGSLYAFLAEKQRRSGSNRTPDSYYRTLRHFFGSSPEVSRSGLASGRLQLRSWRRPLWP